MTAARHELILGGARSGKSRTAEARAAGWLQADPAHQATLVATALAGDAEMAERIERHRRDRAARVPQLQTIETAQKLGAVLHSLQNPTRLLIVDCLTLWVTQCLLPPALGPSDAKPDAAQPASQRPCLSWDDEQAALLEALHQSASPIILVSNEIGLGVMPMSPEARECADALGHLHQRVAAACERVTLMVAGIEMRIKDTR